jgi:uncharacterized protein YbaA (DUF1428 family)
MGRYIDSFVIPIPADRLAEYTRLAESAARIWREHGALDYWECAGDDMKAKDSLSFMEFANAGKDELVILTFIVFESREARDRANRAIMADPRVAEMMETMQSIFDGSRIAYGGFTELVHR